LLDAEREGTQPTRGRVQAARGSAKALVVEIVAAGEDDEGVSFEDRQDLLGHRTGRITTHYSAAELTKLLAAANRVCESDRRPPTLVALRRLSAA
jgi:hypothetical protein